ncbi:hypothetical protein [Streptomyces noursei]|uniref:hypothetical protein n=1 Tax=Streptomyces noursei TaxID=1971 RepID=UPI0019651F27|nr:hypothetical protein [Streptomyces noursei]QRX89942.1 hypothetical protein JNO44_02875 [Streptomyces noursei]
MTNEAAAAPLLTHSLYTDPDPLESNPSGPTEAKITLLVSNGGWSEVRCTGITVTFPVGQRARDLAATSQDVIATSKPDDWEAADPIRTNRFVRFTFTPSGGCTVITDKSLRFDFFPMAVNSTVGVSYPEVTETTATGEESPEERPAILRLPKFPVGIRSGAVTGTNLAVFAEKHTEADPPLVRVARGSKVTIAWKPAPGLARILHWEDSDTGTEIADGAGSLTCGPLLRDTTFTLQTVSEAGGETVNRYDSVTVAVDVPSYPKFTVPGEVGTPDPSMPLHIDGQLTIGQSLTAPSALVTGDLKTQATLSTPSVEANHLRFSGTVNATQIHAATDLTAARVTTTQGLTATGTVRILKAGREKLPANGGTQTMTTDGMVVATAHGGSELTMKVTSLARTFRTTTVGGYGNLIVPVHAGGDVTWAVEGTPDSDQVDFYWFAFGV